MVLTSAMRTANVVAPAMKPAHTAQYTTRLLCQRRVITAAMTPRDSARPAWRAHVASLLSAASILFATASNSQAADLALGAQIFNGNCAACHQGGRNAVIAEKTLDKASLQQYLDGGFNLEAIIYQVENGKGAMPAWSDRLSEEEIQAVSEYVYKQAAEGLWKY